MPYDAQLPSPHPGQSQLRGQDRLLRYVFLVAGLLVAYQLGVILLAPSWADTVTGWFRASLAWPEVFLLLLLSLWLTRAHRPEALTWWLLSIAMLGYAIGKTLLVVFTNLVFQNPPPFPWWSDFFYLLTFPCFFLAPFFWPGVRVYRHSRLNRAKLALDTLLVIGAAAALSWDLLLAPIFMRSATPWLGKAVNLAYPVGDLAGIFVLSVLLLRSGRRYGRGAILSLLILVALCLIIADSWAAWLHLYVRNDPGRLPDLLFLIASLLLPLAALMQFRFARREPVTTTAQRETHAAVGFKRKDVLESIRFLLPFAAVLLASLGLEAHLLFAPQPFVRALTIYLVMLALLLLALARQGVVFLDHARLLREREATRANELALHEANRQMETFLGMASHELRTPLTSITLHIQLARRRIQHLKLHEAGSFSKEERAFHLLDTHLLKTEALLRQQKRLINELLDVSRIRAGRLELHLEPTDLATIARAVVEEQREAWPERSIQLHLPAGESTLISADPDRIEQVVTNYLTNALRYSQEDRPVELGVQGESQHARVWVRDQGPGLPQEEQERIWERFHRAPGIEVQSGSGAGLGIGLYLSKTIIEHHGGQVGVQSVLAQGATFWFTLPLAPPAEGQRR
ncbi:MAG TPA: HAMP domain-containing sensor histidine kinase [Ktedonobacterales bacterium]|jgi:signal transduction histidine kinase